MGIEFRRLPAADRSRLIELMNDPRVRRHMPLVEGVFDEAACAEFIRAKERIWDERGFGPWAFSVDNELVGWGGLQPQGKDVELGLVLHPAHWGKALPIYRKLVQDAFGPLRLESVTVLIPPSRKRVRALSGLGFKPDGETDVSGRRFRRFRLPAPGYYALLYEVVDDYVERRAGFRTLHLRYAAAAQERGELLLGGAFSDPVDRALLVFRAQREAVEAFARHDPYVVNGLVKRWAVRPWTVVVGTAARA